MLTGQPFRRDIEGLRAIAVGLVLLFHAELPFLAGGFVGVDVFFVISGYLITGSLVSEVERTGTVGLAGFYARRARRLLPAAAVVLVATAVAVRTLLPVTAWRGFGGDVAAAAGYVVNWRFAARAVDYLAEDVVASPVQHFWSLAIEEQFYLVWPFVLLAAAALARRHGRSVRLVAFLLLTTTVVAPSLLWSVAQTEARPAIAFFDTTTRMWELGVGGLVAVLGTRRPTGAPRAPRLVGALRTLAVLWLLWLGLSLDGSVAWPGTGALSAVIPTAYLLASAGDPDHPLERALAWRPVQRVGAWSYSLYLWHWPPLAILAARWGHDLGPVVAAAVVVASVLPAWLSYRFVEDPLRRASWLRGRPARTLRLGAATSVAGMAAGLVVLAAVPDPGDTLELPADTVVAEGGADGTTGVDARQADAAVVDGASREVPSAMVEDGDSSIGDGRRPGSGADGVVRPTPTVAPTPTTPPPPSLTPVDGPVGAAVLTRLDRPIGRPTVEALLALTSSITPPPTTVTDDLPEVYADDCHASRTAVAPTICEYGDPAGDVHVALVGDSKAGQWGDALEAIGTRNGWRLTYLLKSTCEFTAAVPDVDGEPDEACRAWNREVAELLLTDPPDVALFSQVSSSAFVDGGSEKQRVAAQVSGLLEAYRRLEKAGTEVVVLVDNPGPGGRVYECVAEHLGALDSCAFEVTQGGGRRAQLAAAARGDHAVLDLTDLVCPAGLCPPVIGNVLVYRQGSHISATYARSLTDAFEARLLPIVDRAVAPPSEG